MLMVDVVDDVSLSALVRLTTVIKKNREKILFIIMQKVVEETHTINIMFNLVYSEKTIERREQVQIFFFCQTVPNRLLCKFRTLACSFNSSKPNRRETFTDIVLVLNETR